MMKYRVDLDFIGTGCAAKAYGGKLSVWSFVDHKPREWFEDFRSVILRKLGNGYLPIYRMADGEYRFLMGRKYNLHRRPLFREIVAVTAEKIRLKNPNKWSTCWGETYSPKETTRLRKMLIDDIRTIANDGYLACYINDNGFHAFTEYNLYVEPFFQSQNITFNAANYVPFHFVVGLLVNDGWQDLLVDKTILIVTGLSSEHRVAVQRNMLVLGAKKCLIHNISATSSMYDTLDLSEIPEQIDLCLVAAGIGSANILKQLRPLQTVALDIGGFINCFVDPESSQHGVFKLPSPVLI